MYVMCYITCLRFSLNLPLDKKNILKILIVFSPV
uniref:Uncharacterized protein n=1 Tax=Anguilla anguilla TaxID=7936 RepID=A0A0E9V5B2_ANGAN